MLKHLKLIILIVLLQVISYGGLYLLIMWLRPDCSVSNQSCSGNSTSQIYLPLAAFIVLPPLIAKGLANRLKRKISWRRILLTHLLASIFVVLIISFATSPPNCGCGGA